MSCAGIARNAPLDVDTHSILDFGHQYVDCCLSRLRALVFQRKPLWIEESIKRDVGTKRVTKSMLDDYENWQRNSAQIGGESICYVVFG